MAFTTLLRSQTMQHKQSSYGVNPWDTADIVSAGFDLILLIGDPGLNHTAGGRQAHTWEGWVAFLGTEWCVLRLKAWFCSQLDSCFGLKNEEKVLNITFLKQLLAIFSFMGIQNQFLLVWQTWLKCCLCCYGGKWLPVCFQVKKS